MLQTLPTGGFKQLDPAKLRLDKYDGNSSRGGVLEVNLEYPKGLHEFHNDYLLVQDKLEITGEMSISLKLSV